MNVWSVVDIIVLAVSLVAICILPIGNMMWHVNKKSKIGSTGVFIACVAVLILAFVYFGLRYPSSY